MSSVILAINKTNNIFILETNIRKVADILDHVGTKTWSAEQFTLFKFLNKAIKKHIQILRNVPCLICQKYFIHRKLIELFI